MAEPAQKLAGEPTRDQLAALLEMARTAGTALPWLGGATPVGPIPWQALAARAARSGDVTVHPTLELPLTLVGRRHAA